MYSALRSYLTRVFACWNWKCALMSATARSLVIVAAMVRSGLHGSLAVAGVELAYVSLTAGLYAGLQQRALGLRSRTAGNLLVVVGVPGLAQVLDWVTHRAVHAAEPRRAVIAVCTFALISALFHLHVMRRGAFLTGRAGRTLREDLRRTPRLVLEFVLTPVSFFAGLPARVEDRPAQTKAVL